MSSKVEVYVDKSNKYRFRLKAGNGQIIATGQAYSSRESCLKGVASLQKNAPNAKIVELDKKSDK